MSFAGYIYDMLRRDKNNRKLWQNLRNRQKGDQKFLLVNISTVIKDIPFKKINYIKNKLRRSQKRMKIKHFNI